METTIDIAKYIWPLLLFLWIWFIVNTSFYLKMFDNFVNERWAFFISWIAWFISWVFIVTNHNIWSWFPEIIISFIWWIILIKTSLILTIPKSMRYLIKNMKCPKNLLIWAWFFYSLLWIYIINFAY